MNSLSNRANGPMALKTIASLIAASLLALSAVLAAETAPAQVSPAQAAPAQAAPAPAKPVQAAPVQASPAEQISEFRLKHGEIRVTRDAVLDRIAADQARAMAEKDELSHEVLGSFTHRMAPSPAGRAAENIAYGYDVFDKTLGQWIRSPEHLKNLLLHNATRVGIASAKNASGKRTYWAMEIAGDYDKPKGKTQNKDKDKDKDKSKGKPASPAVAQAKPGTRSDAKSETRWGAKLPSKPADCHLNIKLIGLCI